MCCVARWWAGCASGLPGLVPGSLRSLPGHPQGGSVQPRSYPPACLQEMQGWVGGSVRRWRQKGGWGGRWKEKGVTVAGWRFPDSPSNNKMRCGAVRNARSAVIVVPVCQECLQSVTVYIHHGLL